MWIYMIDPIKSKIVVVCRCSKGPTAIINFPEIQLCVMCVYAHACLCSPANSHTRTHAQTHTTYTQKYTHTCIGLHEVGKCMKIALIKMGVSTYYHDLRSQWSWCWWLLQSCRIWQYCIVDRGRHAEFLVPRVNTLTMEPCTLPVIALSVWNSLPSKIDCFQWVARHFSSRC